MSTIQKNNRNLKASGVLIPVKIGVPKTVQPAPEPITTLAEIDTTIITTRILEGVATSLGLMPTDTVCITSSTALAYETYRYTIRLVLPESNIAFEVQAIEVPYMVRFHARIQCLIGRDILRYGVLVYNGHASTFSLAFKS
jgi:hypothetical protein